MLITKYLSLSVKFEAKNRSSVNCKRISVLVPSLEDFTQSGGLNTSRHNTWANYNTLDMLFLLDMWLYHEAVQARFEFTLPILLPHADSSLSSQYGDR